jgi:hypothetical protein
MRQKPEQIGASRLSNLTSLSRLALVNNITRLSSPLFGEFNPGSAGVIGDLDGNIKTRGTWLSRPSIPYSLFDPNSQHIQALDL